MQQRERERDGSSISPRRSPVGNGAKAASHAGAGAPQRALWPSAGTGHVATRQAGVRMCNAIFCVLGGNR